jgi:hypothetical protein
MKFSHIKSCIDRFEADPALVHTKDGAIELFCSDCDFYKESDKDLECGAFKLLRRLVEKNILTVKQISDAIRD